MQTLRRFWRFVWLLGHRTKRGKQRRQLEQRFNALHQTEVAVADLLRMRYKRTVSMTTEPILLHIHLILIWSAFTPDDQQMLTSSFSEGPFRLCRWNAEQSWDKNQNYDWAFLHYCGQAFNRQSTDELWFVNVYHINHDMTINRLIEIK